MTTSGKAFVFDLEILNECYKLGVIESRPPGTHLRAIGEPDVVLKWMCQNSPSMQESFARYAGGLLPNHRDTGERKVKDLVRSVADANRVTGAASIKAVDVFMEAFEIDRVAIKNQESFEQVFRDRLATVPILGRLLEDFGISVSQREIATKLRFENCPAICLWVDMWLRFAKGRESVSENEFEDVQFVAAHAYVEASLLEKSLGHVLTSSKSKFAPKCFKDASKFVEYCSRE